MASGFKINKQVIKRMTRELQREFDRNPISIPITAEGKAGPGIETTVYNGPVINVQGDQTQIAWDNGVVSQGQEAQVVAPGFEAIAQALVDTLERLSVAGLGAVDQATVESAAKEVLEEVAQANPDRNVIRRGVSVVRGILAPAAVGVQEGISDEAREFAKSAVEQLTSLLA